MWLQFSLYVDHCSHYTLWKNLSPFSRLNNQQLILKESAIAKGLLATQSPSVSTGSKRSVSFTSLWLFDQVNHSIRSHQSPDVHLPAKIQRLDPRGSRCLFLTTPFSDVFCESSLRSLVRIIGLSGVQSYHLLHNRPLNAFHALACGHRLPPGLILPSNTHWVAGVAGPAFLIARGKFMPLVVSSGGLMKEKSEGANLIRRWKNR